MRARKRGKATLTEIQGSSDLAVSDDGKALAFVSRAHAEGASVLPDSGKIEYRTPESIPLGVLETSVVLGLSHDVVYMTVKGEVVHHGTSGEFGSYGSKKDGDVASFRTSADGSILVVNREEGKWQIHDAKTGKLLKRGTGAVYDVSGKNGAFEFATLPAGNSISAVDASGEAKRKVEVPREIDHHVRSGQVLDANENELLIRTRKRIVVFNFTVGQVVQRLGASAASAQALLASDGIAHDVDDAQSGSLRLVKGMKLADAEAAAKRMVGGREPTKTEREMIDQ